MKPHRKEKIHSTEFSRLREECYNYSKFLWTKFKRRIKTKRLYQEIIQITIVKNIVLYCSPK